MTYVRRILANKSKERKTNEMVERGVKRSGHHLLGATNIATAAKVAWREVAEHCSLRFIACIEIPKRPYLTRVSPQSPDKFRPSRSAYVWAHNTF